MSETIITQEIKDSIQKNLPSVVGDVLKKRLEQADRDAATVLALTQELKEQKDSNTARQMEITSLKAQLASHGELAKREKSVEAREIKADIFALTKQLEAEQKITATVTETLKGLVRNVEYRSSAYGVMPVAVPGSNGCSAWVSNSPHNTITTNTTE